MDKKKIEEAVKTVDIDALKLSGKELLEFFNKAVKARKILKSLGERYLAIAGKMPGKIEQDGTDYDYNLGYNNAIDQATLAAMDMGLSVEKLNRFINYSEKLYNACINADMQEDYKEVAYFKAELDAIKQAYDEKMNPIERLKL